MLKQLSAYPPYILPELTPWQKFLVWIKTFRAPPPPADDQDYEQLIVFMLRWCEHRGVITKNLTADRYAIHLDENVASLSYLLYSTNMVRMTVEEDLRQLMDALSDTSSTHLLTTIQEFAVHLSVLFKAEFIDSVVNRTYRAFSIIENSDQDVSWEVVHLTYPYFWLILMLHTVVKMYTDPVQLEV